MEPASPRLQQQPDAPPAPLDFRALYDAEFGFVWRCLKALGVASEGLDDAAQEVFLVVHRRLSEFRHDSQVRTWLYEIVRNVARNAKRAARRKGQHAALLDNEPSAQPGPFERCESRELVRFMHAFMAELDDKRRDVFVLAIVERMPIPQVAAALSIPVNSAYTRLRAVKRALAEALEAQRGRR
jgi:RNA polymerase sigma-70 factor (ECF subfamily)